MKRKMMLMLLISIFGVWTFCGVAARAEQSGDTSKDKPAATDKSKTDGGETPIDWGDDDDKKKKEPESKPADKTSESQPADKPKEGDEGGREPGKEPEKEVVVLDALEGFYADLARATEMAEDQQKKLVSIQDMVKKKVELQAKKDEKEVEHLEKKISKSNEKDGKKYQKRLDAIQERSKAIEKAGQQAALKTLKGEQIQAWNQALLWKNIEPDMSMLSISDEQRKKAKDACGEVAAKYKGKALTEDAGAKLKMTVVKKLFKDVLDADQVKEYTRYLKEQMQAGKETKEEKKTKGSR